MAFRRSGIVKEIEEAVEFLVRAVESMPDDHPWLPDLHGHIGMSYSERFRRLGQPEDLERMVAHHSQALAFAPDDDRFLPSRHANLGVSYRDRYQRLGQLDDLEKSIEHGSRAFALTRDGDPDLSYRHASLGVSYKDRYHRLGQLEDLEKSINHVSQALLLTPNGDEDLPGQHANLGAAYRDRYKRLGELKDLEKSIEHGYQAFVLTPDGNPSLPGRRANLGVAYKNRYTRLGQPEDLEKSFEHTYLAFLLTPEGDPELPGRHAELGVCYRYRYQRLGQADDLKKAIDHTSHALSLTPYNHPQLPARYLTQANTSWHQYEHTGDASYLSHTLTSFRKATQILTGSPRVRFHNALRWAKLASKNRSLSPVEAFQTTIDLLPQFVWLGATTHQRYQDLATVENLAINAAFAAILISDHKIALEWLEHARCVVWSQTLMLRSPTNELEVSYPDLAARLQSIGTQLHDAGSIASASQAAPSDSAASEQIGKERRRLAKEYEDLLVEARMLPGLEDFLRPIKADRLVCAARHGPVVVINCHEDRCDALIILPGQKDVQHLALPNFTQSKAKTARFKLESSLRSKGVRKRGVTVRQKPGHKDSIKSVLLALWDEVVKPVLEFLGYLNIISVKILPHITWCPTGALSFLPLHAAGDYDQPGSRVFDYVVSSYVPTLTSLLAPTPSRSSSTLRVLAIGQQHTPGKTPLHGTATELASLANHMRAKGEYSELTGSQATTVATLNAMEKHDWVHLACHAHQNFKDPTKSGFFLHDGTLDLAAISRRSFKNKGLAFLSACQTATGDETLPDEAIHLASGMLMAGYPSVIATMWSVMDDDAPFVADKVYAQLMNDGKVGNGEAGRALHNAVAELRDKVGVEKFWRWVPYIHIGS